MKTLRNGTIRNVNDIVSDDVIDKAADIFGIDSGINKSDLKIFLPAIIGGLINRGETPSDTNILLELFKSDEFRGIETNDLIAILEDKSEIDDFLKTGRKLQEIIFGNKVTDVIDLLADKTSIEKPTGSRLLSFLTPIVINKLAGIASDEKLDAVGLTNYLQKQKPEIQALVPGVFTMNKEVSNDVDKNIPSAIHSSELKTNEKGSGLLKWLIPLILAAELVWVLAQKGCSFGTKDDIESDTT